MCHRNPVQAKQAILAAFGNSIPILSVLYVFRGLTRLIKVINHDLLNLSLWFQTNKAFLNINKSKFILLTGKEKYESEQIKLPIHSVKINTVHEHAVWVIRDCSNVLLLKHLISNTNDLFILPALYFFSFTYILFFLFFKTNI